MNKIKLLQGDCLEVMKSIPDGSVDLVLTDPPYNIARENNFHTMGRAGIDFGEWDKGFDQFTWINLAEKKLNKNGSLVIFNDWKNLGDIVKHSESIGLVIKDTFRWIKDNPMPRNRDRRYITDFEVGVWLVKKRAKWVFNRQAETYDRPEFKFPVVAGKEKTKHPTQKPVALMQELLLRHSNEGDVVLDPFMGSGTTGVACENLNRKFIGIELDEDYFNIAKNRVEGD